MSEVLEEGGNEEEKGRKRSNTGIYRVSDS